MAEVTTSELKLKHSITKGHYGYLKMRKLKLLLGGLILLLGIVGLEAINYIVFKTNKTWLSIFAAISAIPMAMQFATYFSLVKFKERPEDEYNEILRLVGNGLLDCDLIIANPDGPSYEFCYTYIHESGIYMFCPNVKIDVSKTQDYVRNFLRLDKCDGPLTIFTDLAVFKKRLKNLEPSDRENCDVKLLMQEGVLRAVST